MTPHRISLRFSGSGGEGAEGGVSEGRIRASAGRVCVTMAESLFSVVVTLMPSHPPTIAAEPQPKGEGSLDVLYPVLKSRVSPLEAEQFRAIAEKHGEKPGTHLKKLIQAYLSCESPGGLPEAEQKKPYWATPVKLAQSREGAAAVVPGQSGSKRLEFRVPEFLKAEVRKRAEIEGMNSAQWISSLVQSSLMTIPVLTDKEVEVVGWANRELAAVGRNLNQIARSMNRAELVGENFKKDEVLTLEGIREVDSKIKKLRAMLLRLVAARHRAWGVENDPAS